MPHKRGISPSALAARFRLRSRSSREREIEFGRDSYAVFPAGLVPSQSFPTLDRALLWLLQEGHESAEIVHCRGWVHVARLFFNRNGWEGDTDA